MSGSQTDTVQTKRQVALRRGRGWRCALLPSCSEGPEQGAPSIPAPITNLSRVLEKHQAGCAEGPPQKLSDKGRWKKNHPMQCKILD